MAGSQSGSNCETTIPDKPKPVGEVCKEIYEALYQNKIRVKFIYHYKAQHSVEKPWPGIEPFVPVNEFKSGYTLKEIETIINSYINLYNVRSASIILPNDRIMFEYDLKNEEIINKIYSGKIMIEYQISTSYSPQGYIMKFDPIIWLSSSC